MNIVAGTAKGRKLKTLPGEPTRPTTGKVREALFNILQAWVPDATWLDLYAGSGAVGLEALSRGAVRAVFVERARPALDVIRENIAATRLVGAEVLMLDVVRAIAQLRGSKFDVVFLDPPYAEDPLPMLQAVAEAGLVGPGGRLAVEHASDRELPEAVGPYRRVKSARYGVSALSIYAP